MENNYVFKDSAPNTSGNAFYDSPEAPHSRFNFYSRFERKRKSGSTKPIILMVVANVLVILLTAGASGVANLLFQQLYQSGADSFVLNNLYSVLTRAVSNTAYVAVFLIFGFIAYKKLSGALKFFGCYAVSSFIASFISGIVQAIAFALLSSGDSFSTHSYYGNIVSVMSIVSVVICTVLSVVILKITHKD